MPNREDTGFSPNPERHVDVIIIIIIKKKKKLPRHFGLKPPPPLPHTLGFLHTLRWFVLTL